MTEIDRRLYAAAQVRELDRRAIEDHGVPGYTLMRRAAAVAWNAAHDRWPLLHSVAVVAGSGNNGGDGYEIARLAQAAGCKVRVCEVDANAPRGDAAT
ncbi:MAG: NAD(P)H-hydrate epimerase, partial [Nevskiales bacterium]